MNDRLFLYYCPRYAVKAVGINSYATAGFLIALLSITILEATALMLT
jgi:hypothetical protein